MEIDIKKASDLSYEMVFNDFGFDLKQHLKSIQVSSVRAKIPAYLRMVKLIVEIYEQISSDLTEMKDNDDIIKLRLMIIDKALYGSKDGVQGLKYDFELLFNHGEFRRNELNKEMIAQYIYNCICLMCNQIQPYDMNMLKDLTWSEKAMQLFDLKFVLSELLEIPDKYRKK
jgi:hypothetical protein